jgi:hypothetical protein
MNLHRPLIFKADGVREPYDERKLEESLLHAGVLPSMLDDIKNHVAQHVREGMTTGEIYSYAFDYLRHKAQPVAVRYSLRRALSELGPDGFPFEKFTARLLEAKGYTVLLNQIVKGRCVEHEIDVVAWNDKELIFVEAKFHNEFGLKSDLKVALYIKSRFDDVAQQQHVFGGKARTLTHGWLVTNTKFTDQAIKYGSCAGVHLVGWNYPSGQSLQNLIDSTGLHPFTCLATITPVQKRLLLQKGVVACKDIAKNPHLLKGLNITANQEQAILAEIELVCGVL